jgi:hypothetical protein
MIPGIDNINAHLPCLGDVEVGEAEIGSMTAIIKQRLLRQRRTS